MDKKERLLDQINTYEQSIHALLTMKQHLGYVFKAESYLGRKLKTTSNNKIQPDTDVTPDILSQFSDNTGLIGEAKLSASDEQQFTKLAQQVKKYDDDLTGWKTNNEKIGHHDLFVLIRQRNTKAFIEHLGKQTDPLYKYERKLAILSFNIDASRNTFYVLEMRGGELPDKLKEDFKKTVEVKFEYLLKEINEVKFYDAKPPVQYTMRILWDFIFPSLPTEEQFRQSRGRSVIEIEVTADQMLEELKKFVPNQGNHRVPDLPKKEWVKESLEKFKEIGQAKKGDSEDSYVIKYWDVPKKKGQTSDFICEKLSSPQTKLTHFSDKKEKVSS